MWCAYKQTEYTPNLVISCIYLYSDIEKKKLRYRLSDMNDYPTYICAVGIESDCRSRVASSIPARHHTFVEIDQEIISPSVDLRCMKYWLSAAQEKVWLVELTIST